MQHIGESTKKPVVTGMGKRRYFKWWAMLALLSIAVSGCGAADKAAESSALAKSDAASSVTNRNQSADSAVAAGASDAKSFAASEAKAESSKPADSLNGGAPAQAGDAYSATDRKIIYKASLTMQVEKYAEVQSQIESAVTQAGGYILQFNENETSYEKSGNFVIKVPASGFSSLLGMLEKMHPSTKKNMQGQDVSEEYVDLTARLKARQVVEQRLIAFMEKATKTDELLAFSNELGKTQEEIERLKGRMRYLDQNVAYSTIELRLSQKLGSAAVIQANDQGPLMQRAAGALNSSAAVLSMIFQWIVVVMAAVLPIAVVVAVIGVPVWLARRARKKKLLEIRQTLLEQNAERTPNPSESKEGPESDN